MFYQVVIPDHYSSISSLEWKLLEGRQHNEEWLLLHFSHSKSFFGESAIDFALEAKVGEGGHRQ